MNRSLTRLTGAVVGALVAAAALAGCSAQPGQAAVMTYTDAQGASRHLTLSEERVQRLTTELGPLGVSSEQVIQVLTDAPFIEKVAQDNGLSMSVEEARAELDAVQAQGQDAAPQVDSASLSDEAMEVIRLSLLSSRLGELPGIEQIAAEYEAWRESAQVSYAPRYTSQARSWIVSGGIPGLPQG